MEHRLDTVAVVQIGPGDGVDLELEVVGRRRCIAAVNVLDGDAVLEQNEPARLVRQFGVGVGNKRRTHRRGHLQRDTFTLEQRETPISMLLPPAAR